MNDYWVTRYWPLVLVAAVGLGAGACGDVTPAIDAAVPDDGGNADAGPDCTQMPCSAPVAEVPLLTERNLDLLFVIDNSGSMQEEQASLAINANRLITALESIEGGLPNVHIAVISPDLGAGPFNISGCSGTGDNGAFQSLPSSAGCSPPSGSFIIDTANPDGTRNRNYTGTLADTFSCIAQLGINGCGFEQPLEAMVLALNGFNPTNDGFLRDDAYLGIVFLTDEDDCSTADTGMFDTSQTTVNDPLGPLSSFRCFEFGVQCEPDDPRTPGARQGCQPRADSQYMYDVQRYVDFVTELKGTPGLVAVAGIIGNPTPVTVGLEPTNNNPQLEPSCVSPAGQAVPGVRLQAFLDAFPGRSSSTTICNEDLSGALTQIGELMSAQFDGGQCLIGNIYDSDPVASGVQFQCTVDEVAANGTRTPVPACDNPADPDSSTNLPCHVIAEDQALCEATDSKLVITTHRGAAPVTPGSRVVVECLVAPNG